MAHKNKRWAEIGKNVLLFTNISVGYKIYVKLHDNIAQTILLL